MTHSAENPSSQEQEADHETRLIHVCERAGFDEVLIPIAHKAIEFYTDRLPYHNIEHMFHVAEAVLSLCDEHNITGYQRQAVVMAALWHDADYGLPLVDGDSDQSKEHRSARLLHQEIIGAIHSLEEPEREQYRFFADVSAGLIISTHADLTPKNILELILNEADLSNLSGPLPQMLQNSVNYFIEGCMLRGELFTGDVDSFLRSHLSQFTQWCVDNQKILTYLVTNKIIDQAKASLIVEKIPNVSPASIFRILGFNRNTENTSEDS